MPPSERSGTRWLGGVGLAVVLAAFVLALGLGFGVQGLTRARLDRAVAPDQEALLETAAGVAEQSLGRALGHGLPLADLPGIEGWLETMRGNLGGLSRIELVLQGRTFSAGKAGAGDLVRARPLDLPGTEVRLVFHLPPHALPDTAAGRLWYPVLAALVAALIAGIGFRAGTGGALARSGARLDRRLARLEAGDFAADAPDAPGLSGARGRMPADAALHALALRLEPVNLRHALLLQHADRLRGIDFDGSLTAQVEAVLAGLPAAWREADVPVTAGQP